VEAVHEEPGSGVFVSENGLEGADGQAVQSGHAEDQAPLFRLAALHDRDLGGGREVDVVDGARADACRNFVEQCAQLRVLLEIEPHPGIVVGIRTKRLFTIEAMPPPGDADFGLRAIVPKDWTPNACPTVRRMESK
jgi:hypothetical protein